MQKSISFLLLAQLFLAPAAFADTVSIGPKKDNTVYSESEHTNGGGQHFFAGTTQENNYRRPILSFDVAGSVPAGSAIESATLTLHMSKTHRAAMPVVAHLHRCLTPWGEGTGVGPLGEGSGAPPGPGDATWSFNMFNTSRWNAPGGDYSSVSSASALVGNEIAFYTWSSAGLAQDVQSWLDGTVANFGWVLVADGEGQRPITAKRFDSRENSTAEFRPVLRIVYTPPADCDGGIPDAGMDGGGPSDAGSLEDAGTLVVDAGVSEDPIVGPRPDRSISEVGRGGCQMAGGPSLGLVAFAILALIRARRRCE